jgi:trehalose 6-phosphate phosphatase
MWEKAAGDVQAQRKLGASEMIFAQHAWPVLSAEDALFLDVDGTLLEFAARPDEVSIPKGLRETLKAIETKLDGALALISGREIDDLDRLFAPLRLPAAGVHGAEIRLSATASAHAFGRRLPEALIEAIAERAHAFPGVLIERKDFTIAVHYAQARGCKDALRAMIEEEMERQPMEGAEILEAHLAFEVKCASYDKGSAIETILETPPFLGRKPIFVGDDITDEYGFSAVKRASGQTFSVAKPRRDATQLFANPAEVRAWLAACVNQEAA